MSLKSSGRTKRWLSVYRGSVGQMTVLSTGWVYRGTVWWVVWWCQRGGMQIHWKPSEGASRWNTLFICSIWTSTWVAAATCEADRKTKRWKNGRRPDEAFNTIKLCLRHSTFKHKLGRKLLADFWDFVILRDRRWFVGLLFFISAIGINPINWPVKLSHLDRFANENGFHFVCLVDKILKPCLG